MRVTPESIAAMRERPFGSHHELIRAHASLRPKKAAVIQDSRRITYAELDVLIDRIAAGLQRDGIKSGDPVAICAAASIEYSAVFMATLRAAGGVVPLAPSSTAQSLMTMLEDCGATILFLDAAVATALAPLRKPTGPTWVMLDGSDFGVRFEEWLPPNEAKPQPASMDPDAAFNIIYSSGTTGTPKGIVQSHQLRWLQLMRDKGHDFEADSAQVTLVSTPLYSNTTLVSFLPTLANGGTVVLQAKFDAVKFLELAQKHRVTHAMLVPVQYRRLMAVPDFDRYDLSSFVMKYSTSAPFAADIKAEVLKRWPGGLIEYYGMTEGGASCQLLAHERPDKLHTVGCPFPGHEMRVIDEEGRELPADEVGEIVGRSPVMMNGYLNQPKKTSEAEWYDESGNRFIRTGDVGRFDAEGFLTLMDRRKDMIISGGFNVYPSDIEAVLVQHEDVLEAAVVGVPSERWGETPVGFVVPRAGRSLDASFLCSWANERLGKTQAISAVEVVSALPRSAIGKVLKRELRDRYKPRAS
ncbi:MAG TPA: class I adenylate-forming enzyme family protein [Povalibacter sp.]|uniref:class I adenylate-forming enzyme family protein n=2 Tax=Povalibacter sp. TaxID=1962978 RepID=UPI002C8014C7|nr:class I adenylate-forming enzyme family protein [Povalibacter sp.]HMN43040.1 class I adenylate-forming enzyme family protein [Povalibacter sp.]